MIITDKQPYLSAKITRMRVNKLKDSGSCSKMPSSCNCPIAHEKTLCLAVTQAVSSVCLNGQ